MSSTSLSNGGYTVTLDCGDGVEVPAEGKVFYIALPTISGAHLTVRVDDGYGIYTLAQTNNTATFDRNTLHLVPFNATENICVDYAERIHPNSNTIKYAATSQLNGFEVGASVWEKTVLSHDYNATSKQGTITFNSDITEIPYFAFEYNSALLSIKLPESVETINLDAFYECGSLTSVSMPGVKTVGYGAFQYCYSLTNVNLPSATSIGNNAFYECTALTTLDLPSVTSIGGNAFYRSGIQTITFGPNLGHLGVRVFALCGNITDIYCKPQIPPGTDWDGEQNCFSDMDCTPTLRVPRGSSMDYYSRYSWPLDHIVEEDF